jgi:DENN (AEX-3) domain
VPCRVLLRSRQFSQLTFVAEALCQLLRPLRFHHTYIPVLPFALAECVEAPTPYLMGLHSDVPVDRGALEDVVVVDLDVNEVRLGGNGVLPCVRWRPDGPTSFRFSLDLASPPALGSQDPIALTCHAAVRHVVHVV